MVSEKLLNNIRFYGNFAGEEKRRDLEDMEFRFGEKAQYVIITGCVPPQSIPHVFQALKNLIKYFRIDYTLLVKEFCCGWILAQSEVTAKNKEGIAQAIELAGEFVRENFRQAEALGAKSIVLFCSACEPSYSHYARETELEIISYCELLDRYFNSGKLDMEIDYYAGCYRFRRWMMAEAVDISAAVRILNKIAGLKVNYLDNNLCCYIPPHLAQLTGSLKFRNIVTICTGCYQALKRMLPEKKGCQVKMLPEIVLEAVRDK